MATSGSSSVAVTSWDTLKFDWSQTSQSIPNNCTYIKWTLTLVSGKYGAIYGAPTKEWVVTVNGTKHTGTASASINNNTSKTLASGTDTIYHNNDGTKSFSFSFSHNFSITFSNTWIGTKSGSGSATLNTIARYAEMTEIPSPFNDETTSLTVKFKNPGNFDLQFKIEAGGDTALITRNKPTKSSPYTFTLSEDEKKKLRKKCTGNSLDVRFTVATYINGALSYWSYKDTKMSLINYMPTLSPTVIDEGSVSTVLTGDPNKIILNYNNAKVTFNASAKKEATISSMKVTCGNNSRTSDGRMDYVSNGTFVFSVTDSRGYSVSKTITKTTIPYTPLTCSLKANPNLSEDNSVDVALTISGNYFSGSFGATNNSLTVLYRYKTINGEYPKDSNGNDIWTTLPNPTISNGVYTATATINSLDYTEAYVWQAKAIDKCNPEGILTAEQTTKIQPVFDWSESDFNFNVPVSIQGSPLLDYVIEQGISGIWTYRKWYSGIAECWGVSSGASPINTLWYQSTFYVSDDVLCEKYPTDLFASQPGVQATYQNPSDAGGSSSWLYSDSVNTLPSGYNLVNSTGAFRLCRPTKGTYGAYNIFWHAIGRWK